MVAAAFQQRSPFNLVVAGEAESWLPALDMIVGPRYLTIHKVAGDTQLLSVVESGLKDLRSKSFVPLSFNSSSNELKKSISLPGLTMKSE